MISSAIAAAAMSGCAMRPGEGARGLPALPAVGLNAEPAPIPLPTAANLGAPQQPEDLGSMVDRFADLIKQTPAAVAAQNAAADAAAPSDTVAEADSLDFEWDRGRARQSRQATSTPAETAAAVPADAEAETEDGPVLDAQTTSRERLRRLLVDVQVALDDPELLGDDRLRLALLSAALLSLTPDAEAALVGGVPRMIESLAPDELEAVRAVQAMLADLASPGDGSATVLDRLAAELAEAARRVDAPRPIRIERLELCTAVEGYGMYAPIASDHLRAGRLNRAIIYVELGGCTEQVGLAAGATADQSGTRAGATSATGSREVRTSIECHVFTDDGLNVWSSAREAFVHRSSSPLRDIHRIQWMALPPTLGVGSYVLKVTVWDDVAGTMDERTVALDLVDPSAAFRLAETPSR